MFFFRVVIIGRMPLPQSVLGSHAFLFSCWCLFYIVVFSSAFSFWKDDVPRLKSVLTMTVSLLVAPASLLRLLHILQGWVNGSIVCFMAFALMDSLLGFVYYPTYMMNLDGFAHHAITGSFCAYVLLYTNNPLLSWFLSTGLLVECPTILLSGACVFPQQLRPLKQKYFANVFLLCRLVVPTLLIIELACTGTCPWIVYIFYGMFTYFNTQWYLGILKKQHSSLSI